MRDDYSERSAPRNKDTKLDPSDLRHVTQGPGTPDPGPRTSLQPWTVKRRQYLLKRPWITLREDHVVLPHGAEMEEFHVVEYPDWAATVCLNQNEDLVFVEQYRHGIERSSLELPAGVIEPNESPLEAARRELLEETGYVSDHWSSLGACSTDPSNHSNYAHLFVCTDAVRIQDPDYDDEELLATRIIRKTDVSALIRDRSIVHGIHLTALMFAHLEGIISL